MSYERYPGNLNLEMCDNLSHSGVLNRLVIDSLNILDDEKGEGSLIDYTGNDIYIYQQGAGKFTKNSNWLPYTLKMALAIELEYYNISSVYKTFLIAFLDGRLWKYELIESSKLSEMSRTVQESSSI